jgi:hypothetical protein
MNTTETVIAALLLVAGLPVHSAAAADVTAHHGVSTGQAVKGVELSPERRHSGRTVRLFFAATSSCTSSETLPFGKPTLAPRITENGTGYYDQSGHAEP